MSKGTTYLYASNRVLFKGTTYLYASKGVLFTRSLEGRDSLNGELGLAAFHTYIPNTLEVEVRES